MSQYKDDIVATEVVYFWFAANLTTGASGDGATPLYDVRLAGAAAGAAPTASGTPTLLSHANYTDGLHEIAVDTTGYANGEYAVFCTLTISTVNPAGFVGSFRVRTANRIDGLVTDLAKVPKSDGSVIFNATAVGDIKSGLSTQAELNKVPKSDGTSTWNVTALASIQTEANDAIVANRLDELLNADSDIDGAAPPTVGSVFHELMTKTAGSFTYDQATDSLEAIGDRGDAEWITATGFSTFDPTTDPVTLADGAHGGVAATLTLKSAAVNNGDLNGVAVRVQGTGTGNSHGVHITSANGKGLVVDAASDAVAFDSSAARGLVVTGATGDIVGDITGNVSGSVGSVTGLTPGTVADQVWEEAIADHSGTGGSTAESLAAAGTAGDPWLTPIPGLYLPGTAGAILGTNIDAAISTRTKPADTQARVTLVDTCTTNSDMRGTDGANTTTPPTAIENADALLDRDMATGADNGSSTVRTVRQALRFLRNKWSVAAGTLTVTKENDSTASWTATLTTDAAADPVTGSDPAGP